MTTCTNSLCINLCDTCHNYYQTYKIQKEICENQENHGEQRNQDDGSNLEESEIHVHANGVGDGTSNNHQNDDQNNDKENEENSGSADAHRGEGGESQDESEDCLHDNDPEDFEVPDQYGPGDQNDDGAEPLRDEDPDDDEGPDPSDHGGDSDDESAESLHDEDPDDDDPSDPDDPDSSHGSPTRSNPTSFGTIEPELLRTQNFFLKPELVNDEIMISMLHITKQQFFDFVDRCQLAESRKSRLSGYSKAFLFRLKLAGNWSFYELACVFGISVRVTRRIFWRVTRKAYMNALALPNFLNPDLDVDGLLEDIYNTMDPYFQKLFKHFKDPRGINMLYYFATHVLTYENLDNLTCFLSILLMIISFYTYIIMGRYYM